MDSALVRLASIGRPATVRNDPIRRRIGSQGWLKQYFAYVGGKLSERIRIAEGAPRRQLP
jgi:hypothetical protein